VPINDSLFAEKETLIQAVSETTKNFSFGIMTDILGLLTGSASHL